MLSLLLITALAQSPEAPTEPAPAEATAPAPGLTVTTDLRDEYLAGEPVLVRFTVKNDTSATRSFADLSSRPWLVRFELTDAAGSTKTWSTAAPETDPGGSWSVSARGQRQVLLEIPSSRGLAAGAWSLEISIEDDAGARTLPAQHIVVAKARPVAGETLWEPHGLDTAGHQTVWLHQATKGFDLYLHHADGEEPGRVLGDYHLAHFDDKIEPVLSHARPSERWDRYIYWLDGRTIRHVRLQAQALRGEQGAFTLPWPSAQLAGRGATDAHGGLHVPVWIPSPKGGSGELRVASLRDRGASRVRVVGRFATEPRAVETAVDADGNLRLLVHTGEALQVYALSAASDLPAVGRTFPVEGQPLMARFGWLGDAGGRSGGLSVLVASTSGEQVATRWYSLEATTLKEFPAVSLGGELVDLLPRDWSNPGLLVATGERSLAYTSPGMTPRAVTWVPDPTLVLDGEDKPRIKALATGGPVAVLKVGE